MVKASPVIFCKIIAYYDEIELCNPLGTSVIKNKIACIFYTIGNLHQKYKLTYKTIFLSTSVNYFVVERQGIDGVKPSIDKLNKLSISISKNGTMQKYKGALPAFLANNLASHMIGGFKLSQKNCRSCMATILLPMSYDSRT